MTALVTVCKQAGISYKQGDHWIRQGYVEVQDQNVGQGFPRDITDEEAKQFHMIAQLLDHGFTLKSALERMPHLIRPDREFEIGDEVELIFRFKKKES
jgi:DNA-binding transcriptional MerR regulator